MENTTLDLSSKRARKARISVILDKKWLLVLMDLVTVFSFFGWLTGVLLLHIPALHLLLLPAAYGAVTLAWYHGELKDLPPTLGGTNSLDQLLERRLLGRIKKDTTPSQLVKIVMSLKGGIFYANRYGISEQFLNVVVSEESKDISVVWDHCLSIARSVNSTNSEGVEITAATVTAALLLSFPESSFYLAQLQIDQDDVVAGLKWYDHIQAVFKKIEQKQHHGGIGRDLSFGWTPLLSRLGVNITEGVQGGMVHRQIEGHEEVLQQVMHLLAQPGQRNAALVGEIGVGKTTLVYALAQKLITASKGISPELRYRQVIELDATGLISRAKGRGELESLLIRVFNEAVHAKNIILFLDDAQLFLQDGVGSVDLSSVLLPVLEGGRIQLILSFSDQEWLKLSQLNPGLARLLNRVVVRSLEHDDTMRVMEDQILLLEGRNPVIYMYQSLKEAYRLSERFIRDQAFPGKAIRLLEAASGFAISEHFITQESVQKAVEKSFDVKVQTASNAEERDTLLNMEGLIHQRMINQTRAVQVVSDALRRARAGVRNQNKPSGTFLFLGPTGVGKTELSKALAAVYFGGEERLIRLDLNEYSQPTDVTRLLEVGAQNTNSLTAQISKQPFSVVLLDEIEKAHPNVLNVLLQMLDEGMLLDGQNKQISFRDAIVIATSNAGADKIREHISKGKALDQFEEQFVDELIDSNVFRPEFLNRFDEIVLFRPLTVEELKQVVDLIVAGINKTLGAQKVSVSLTDSAKQLLAETGYDPRLGARPLRRVTQRSIENIMAQKLLSGNLPPGSVVELDRPELEAALSRRSAAGNASEPTVPANEPDQTLGSGPTPLR